MRLKLRPSLHFRGTTTRSARRRRSRTPSPPRDRLYELTCAGPYPVLRLRLDGDGAALTLDGVRLPDVLYRVEESRGYDGVGTCGVPASSGST